MPANYADKFRTKSRMRRFRRKTLGRQMARKAMVSAATKAYVDRQIARTTEDKSLQYTSRFQFASVQQDPALYGFPIAPTNNAAVGLIVYQGVGQGNRIGNVIRPKKVTFRYVIHPMPQDAFNNVTPIPQDVRIWIGSLKGNSVTIPGAGAFGELFQDGDGSTGPVNNITDMIAVVNKDKFSIKKDILEKVGTSSAYGAGGVPTAQYYTNNDYSFNCMRTVDLTSIFPKSIKFDDNTQDPNWGLWCWLEAVPADGQTGTDLNVLQMYYQIDFNFEDA